MQSLLSDLMFFVLLARKNLDCFKWDNRYVKTHLSNRGFMAAKVAGHQRNFGATPSLPARIGC